MKRSIYTKDLTEYIEEKNNRIKLKEKEEKRKKEKEREEHQSILDRIQRKKTVKEQCAKFIDEITDHLVVETFQRIFDKSMKDSIFKDTDNESNTQELSRSLLANYVEEEGSYTILRRMRSGGILLTELAKNIEDTAEKIKSKVDPTDETTFSAERQDLDNFYQTLDMTDFSDVVNLIQARVAQAAEDFTDRNYNDKIDLQDALRKSEDNVNNLKKGIRQSDENLEQMKEDTMLYYKKVNNRIFNRSKSIYEQMVYTLSESVMKNPDLKEVYTSNNRLNLEKIEETVNCMYTFLEMVNTLKIQPITESYIKKVLNDLSE